MKNKKINMFFIENILVVLIFRQTNFKMIQNIEETVILFNILKQF